MSSVLSQAPPSILTDSPNLRKELLTWLASRLPFYKSFSTEEALSLVQPSLNCLQDRTAEVRKAAQGILGALAGVCGMHEFKRRCIEVQPRLFGPQSNHSLMLTSLQTSVLPPPQAASSTTVNLPMKRQATTPRKMETDQPKRLFSFPTSSSPSPSPPPSDQKLGRAERDKGSAKWNGPDGFVIRQDLIDVLREQLSLAVSPVCYPCCSLRISRCRYRACHW